MKLSGNKKIKYSYKIAILFMISLFVIISLPIKNVKAEAVTTILASEKAGDYQIITDTGATPTEDEYTVTLKISRQYDSDAYASYWQSEVYEVLIEKLDGTQATYYHKFAPIWNEDIKGSELTAVIPDVAFGSTITVKNIKVESQNFYADGNPYWDNYSRTYLKASIVDEDDITNIVEIVGDNPILLVADETTTHTVGSTSFEEADRVTTDTFESLGGQYSLMYMLNNYNVVSLDEIESTHIVGPIIAQNTAHRTTTTTSSDDYDGYLVASDLSKGTVSYVGMLSAHDDALKQSGLQFNYRFDRTYFKDFIPPLFYTSNTWYGKADLSVSLLKDIDYISIKGDTLEENGALFISPNDHGRQQTYLNDKFVDFNALTNVLKQGSFDTLENGNVEGYFEQERYVYNYTQNTVTYYSDYNDKSTAVVKNVNDYIYECKDVVGSVLKINAEESWTITADEINGVKTIGNNGYLAGVDIILPEDYDYYNNPYLFPTTVSFDCDYINPTTIKGVTHSQMPFTYLDGEEYKVTGVGENTEYGEVGNKIVWNYPNLTTTGNENRFTTIGYSQNIAGHIIAPNAEFWNYDINGNIWEGGNINGAVLVKSFYSGIAEMHMWSYDGQSAVVYGVKAKKTFDNESPERSYTFELDAVRLPDGSLPEGLLNVKFPMTAKSSVGSGEIKFSSLAFNKAGTYKFTISEVVTDFVSDAIIFDKSVYGIDITVAGKGDEYVISNVVKYRIKDSEGNVTNEGPLSTDPKENVFIFNNKSVPSINITFTKKSTSGYILPEAKFTITQVISADNHNTLVGGYTNNITSDAKGSVYIDGLEKEQYYKLVEYEAPYGHIKSDGYWIIYVSSHGVIYTTAYDGAPEIVDGVILNKPEDHAYLDLILTKSDQMTNLLTGVEFRVQRVIISSDGTPKVVTGGFDNTYTTNENGIIEIKHLEPNHTYMITETNVFDGYHEHTGYWLIDVKGNPLKPSEALTYTIKEYDENNKFVSDVTNNTLLNEKKEFVLPLTGGAGNTTYYIIGFILMSLSALLYYRYFTKKHIKKY